MKKFFLVVGPLRFYPPYNNGLVVYTGTRCTAGSPANLEMKNKTSIMNSLQKEVIKGRHT